MLESAYGRGPDVLLVRQGAHPHVVPLLGTWHRGATSALADEMRDSVVSNAAPIEERESMVGDVDRALAMMGESAREGETAAEPAPAPPTPNGGWLPASVWLPGSSPVGQRSED